MEFSFSLVLVDVPQEFRYAVTVYIFSSPLILALHLSFGRSVCGSEGLEEMR
jgi:hypothetical protein